MPHTTPQILYPSTPSSTLYYISFIHNARVGLPLQYSRVKYPSLAPLKTLGGKTISWNKTSDDAPKTRTVSDLHKRFKPSIDLELNTGLKQGIFGRSKTGKSHYCITAHSPGKPIYAMDTEGNLKKEAKRLSEEAQREIFIDEILQYTTKKKDSIDLAASIDALIESCDFLTDVINNEEEEFPKGTIVVDSGTDPWTWLGSWLEENADRTKSGNISRLEWGKANKRYTDFMYMLLNSNWDVIMTFRAQSAVNNKGEDLGYDKARWQKDTEYWLDLITQMFYNGKDYIMRLEGDRFGNIGGQIENPSWQKTKEYIEKQSGLVLQ